MYVSCDLCNHTFRLRKKHNYTITALEKALHGLHSSGWESIFIFTFNWKIPFLCTFCWVVRIEAGQGLNL